MAAAHTGTSVGGTSTGDVKRKFDFSASDFATIVTTTAFVDKTLMIRDVYNASSRVLITAPPRFGKSINLDMVKRFFEVEVDAHGNPKPVHTTNNYKLFQNNSLEIYRDIGFFNEHIGKHPVVYIDFKPLGSITDSSKILNALKMITENSFNQHRYILQHSLKKQVFSGITGFSANDFRKYVSGGIAEDEVVYEVNLANSFKHLSTILNRFFGKKVFVLIDNYDAFLESPLFKNHTDRERMESFVDSSIGRLLSNVICVDRVLITGVIPVIFEGFLSSKNNVELCRFLDSHPFTKYYGLTPAEVDAVLRKVIDRDEDRDDVKNTINDYYNAYETGNSNIRVYNVFSVLKYVCRRTVQSYWCERRYINKVKKCFKNITIRRKLLKLLLGNGLKLDTSHPLSMADVLEVNHMIRCYDNDEDYEIDYLSIEVQLFFVLLYHFGYLSVTNEFTRGVVRVKIASDEIKYGLGKAVFDENREFYSSSQMNNILSDLDAIQPGATGLHDNFHSFFHNLSRWLPEVNFKLTRFLECLFMNLVAKTNHSRVMGRKLGSDAPTTAVLLQNRHKVVICVTYDCNQRAEGLHQKVTNDGGEEHMFDGFNDVRGKVIIAITCGFSIAYSYYFKTGDNLRAVRTIP